MEIAIYGAGGMVGGRIVAEAVGRGHEAVGVTRSGDVLPPGVRALLGSTNDPSTIKAVAAVVVSAIGLGRTGGDPRDFLDVIATLTTTAGRTGLLVVGGAGSLVVDGQRLVDSPGFPPYCRPGALIIVQALDHLLELGDGTDRTMLSRQYWFTANTYTSVVPELAEAAAAATVALIPRARPGAEPVRVVMDEQELRRTWTAVPPGPLRSRGSPSWWQSCWPPTSATPGTRPTRRTHCARCWGRCSCCPRNGPTPAGTPR